MPFKCNDCGLCYPTEKIAKECEDFCKTHSACSMEITKKSIPCE